MREYNAGLSNNLMLPVSGFNNFKTLTFGVNIDNRENFPYEAFSAIPFLVLTKKETTSFPNENRIFVKKSIINEEMVSFNKEGRNSKFFNFIKDGNSEYDISFEINVEEIKEYLDSIIEEERDSNTVFTYNVSCFLGTKYREIDKLSYYDRPTPIPVKDSLAFMQTMYMDIFETFMDLNLEDRTVHTSRVAFDTESFKETSLLNIFTLVLNKDASTEKTEVLSYLIPMLPDFSFPIELNERFSKMNFLDFYKSLKSEEGFIFQEINIENLEENERVAGNF